MLSQKYCQPSWIPKIPSYVENCWKIVPYIDLVTIFNCDFFEGFAQLMKLNWDPSSYPASSMDFNLSAIKQIIYCKQTQISLWNVSGLRDLQLCCKLLTIVASLKKGRQLKVSTKQLSHPTIIWSKLRSFQRFQVWCMQIWPLFWVISVP